MSAPVTHPIKRVTDQAKHAADPIDAAMIRTLMLQIPSQTAAGVVVTVYMVGTAWAFSSPVRILIWAAAVLFYVGLRFAISRRFVRRQPPDAEVARWAGWYTLSMLLAGVLWGLSFLLFAHPNEPITVALTLSCLYSVAAGSTPSCAYHPPAILAVVLPLFAAVLGKLLWTGDFEYILLGVASALYGLTMIGYCRVQSRTLQEGFRIRFENDELVRQLARERAEADDARHAAEQASLAKSQFLAAASHDLRQPLYALSLFSSSLRELKLDDEGRNVVGRIQDSIGVMESLFEGLLDVSRLEAGVVQAHVDRVSVNALFDRLSQVYHPIAMDRGLDLRFRSDGEWVASDAMLLEQVLSNIISNAMRYTHRGGVLVAARGRGARIRFEIWDTGVGIAETDQKIIFQEFVQIGNPQRDRRKGLGLGLPIARRAAALLGATLEVRSRPGQGSCFSLAQPRHGGQEAGEGRIPLPFKHSFARDHAIPDMVVEDDQDVAAALADLLTRWQVRFEMFPDGQSALAGVAGGGRFSMVLADYRLTGPLNGLDLIEELRRRHPLPRPQAILITGDFDSGLIGKAHERNVPILHKPLRADLLRDLLGLER